MPIVVGVGVGEVMRSGIGEEIGAVDALEGVAVAVGVHNISTQAEIVPFTHVEVEAEALRSVHSVVAAESAETGAVAIGETEVVGVVEATEDSELVAVAEVVNHSVYLVAVVGAISGAHGAKPSVVHPLLDGEVDNGLVFTIIDTG